MDKNRRSAVVKSAVGAMLSIFTVASRSASPQPDKSNVTSAGTSNDTHLLDGNGASRIGFEADPALATSDAPNIAVALNRILFRDRVKLSDLGCIATKATPEAAAHNRTIIQDALSRYSVIEVDGDYHVDRTLWLSYPGFQCKTVALVGASQQSSIRAYGSWFAGKDGTFDWWEADGTRWVLACLNTRGEFSGGPLGLQFIMSGVTISAHASSHASSNAAQHDAGLRAGGMLFEGVTLIMSNVWARSLRYGVVLRNTINSRIADLHTNGVGDAAIQAFNLYPASAPQWGEKGERYSHANSIGLWLSSAKIRVWKNDVEVVRPQTNYNDNSQVVSFNSNTDMIGLLDDGSYSVYTGEIAYSGFRNNKIGIVTNTSKNVKGNWFEGPHMHAIVYGEIATTLGRSFARSPIRNNHFSYGVGRSNQAAILERNGSGALIEGNLLEGKWIRTPSKNICLWASESNAAAIASYFYLNQVAGPKDWRQIAASARADFDVVLMDESIANKTSRGKTTLDSDGKALVHIGFNLKGKNIDVVVNATIMTSDPAKILPVSWYFSDNVTVGLAAPLAAAHETVAYEVRLYVQDSWRRV